MMVVVSVVIVAVSTTALGVTVTVSGPSPLTPSGPMSSRFSMMWTSETARSLTWRGLSAGLLPLRLGHLAGRGVGVHLAVKGIFLTVTATSYFVFVRSFVLVVETVVGSGVMVIIWLVVAAGLVTVIWARVSMTTCVDVVVPPCTVAWVLTVTVSVGVGRVEVACV
jgi:hypothetical protein